MKLTDQIRAEYQAMYESANPRKEVFALVDTAAASIGRFKDRYDAAVEGTGVPWQWIGIVHLMESSLAFNKHLHNGDPTAARTVNVPIGRPVVGRPPFTWEESAKDAIAFKMLHLVPEWDIPTICYQFERWNGFGYRMRGIPSPYLWAGSQHYTAGRFVKDGKFSPTAVSKQLGAAVVLKRLLQLAPIVVPGKGGADSSQSTTGPVGHGPIT